MYSRLFDSEFVKIELFSLMGLCPMPQALFCRQLKLTDR